MAAALPALSEPVDIVLHIGTGKTGTSSVQALLHQNRERLAEHGLLYPTSPGSRRHVKLGLAVRSPENLEKQNSWHRQKSTSPERFSRRALRRLRAEIEASGIPGVLLSDESLYALPDDALGRLRGFVDVIARKTRVVVYLRRQDDHLCSRYQQVVKAGEVLRLADRLAQVDVRSTYDYHSKLKTWQRIVHPDELVVRRFERGAFLEGSLYRDFLDALGFDGSLDDLVEPERPRNESLDAETVEFLRVLNIYRVEHQGARAGVIDNTRITRRLAPGSTGPTLTLPDRTLDAFMATYQASNEAVVRDYLGDADHRLFHTERKGSGTTTEQRLDPARLDHFMALVDLPEETHADVRRIAEREAGSWRDLEMDSSGG